MTLRMLFVCSGNTCRSPMAAAIAGAKLGSAAMVSSAGLECGPGLPAARNAIKVMAERGLDISKHRSTDVEELDVSQFDVIIAMSPEIAHRLMGLNAKNVKKWDIPDPYGGDEATYRRAAHAIDIAIKGLEP